MGQGATTGLASVAVGRGISANVDYATVLGYGAFTYSSYSVAVGHQAGVGANAAGVAIGPSARVDGGLGVALGQSSIVTGVAGVSIGGYSSVGGSYSLGLGYMASATAPNSIVLNANGATLNATNSGFFVKPIRSSTSAIGSLHVLKYNTTTGEIAFDATANTITVNTIDPATAAAVAINGGLRVDGNLTVTGTSTLAGLTTFNAGIRTDTISPATGTSVSVPGSGQDSLQIGAGGTFKERTLLGYFVYTRCQRRRPRIAHHPAAAQATGQYSMALGWPGK